MLTNCPNCGAPLTKDGWCDYCKTKVRLANLIDIDQESMHYRPVEMLLRFKNPDGTLVLMPFMGYLANVEVTYDTLRVGDSSGLCHTYSNSMPDIHLELDGHMCDLPKWEIKEAKETKNEVR